MRISSSERGNAFFFILIGIVLFAALSYAIASGGRSGIGGVSEERIKLTATEIIQFGTALESAVARATLAGNKIWGLDFANPTWKLVNNTIRHTANATCTSNSCRVFGPTLGLTPYVFPREHFYSQGTYGPMATSPGHGVVIWIRVTGLGTNLPEVVLLYPSLSLSMCRELNRKLNNGLSDPPPTDTLGVLNTSWAEYTGNISAIPALGADGLGDAAVSVRSKSAVCVQESATWGYYYYQVLAIN